MTIPISIEENVLRGMLADLIANTPEGAVHASKQEKLDWYERSHAIVQIQSALPKKRTRKTKETE